MSHQQTPCDRVAGETRRFQPPRRSRGAFLLAAVLLGLVTSGQRTAVADQPAAAKSFQMLLDDMDRHYSHFATKAIKWRETAEAYRAKAELSKGPDEFAAAIAPMLAALEDMHVWIVKPDGSTVHPCRSSFQLNADLGAVVAELNDVRRIGPRRAMLGLVGRTRQGYGYVSVTRLQAAEEDVDNLLAAIRALFDTPGMILDLRRNSGGSEPLANRIAGLLADQPRVYGRSKYRLGTDHNRFYEAPQRVLRPAQGKTYTRPLVCLTGPGCVSSGEALVQMMKALPQATLIGQPTRGASGNPAPVHLPNGVSVWYSRWVDMLPDGTPIEGLGIQPNVLIKHEGPGDPTFRAAIKMLDEKTSRSRLPGGTSGS
jgi:hypothetical protein